MRHKNLCIALILMTYFGREGCVQAQGIPQACIELNDKLTGDWYETNGEESYLFPRHIKFVKQGPANGGFIGFSAPALYFLTESCDAIGVTDTQGRLIVTYGAELTSCALTLDNWNRVHSYSGGVPHLDIHGFAIDQDNPKETAFAALSNTLPVVYGGSIPSTSDNLRLTAEGCSVVQYTWSVTGTGASNYAPPPPSPTASQWEVGDIKPIPGRLTFKCQALLKNGQTVQASKGVEVGIRTDDVMIIGWIDPRKVPLPSEGVETWLTDRFHRDGTSTDCVGDIAWLAYNYTALNHRSLTYPDRQYILQWMFRFSANWETLDDLAAGFTDSDGILSELKIDQFRSDVTKFKLFARLQIKFQVSGGKFKSSPIIIKENPPTVGSTEDPCRTILNPLFPGQDGPAITPKAKVSNDRVVTIIDGSPDFVAIRAINTLMGKNLPSGVQPKFWEDIGARITFTPSGGTSPQIIQQPYPTYYEYRNGVLHSPSNTNPVQSDSPIVNFWPNPYPFGPAKCLGPGGITPGGRCGSMLEFGRPARNKFARIPPYVAGFVKSNSIETGQAFDLPSGGPELALDQAVVEASDQNRPPGERVAAYRSLWSFAASERENALRRLVTSDEIVAVPAANELIRGCAHNIGSSVSKEIMRWSEIGQLSVLGAMLEELDLSSCETSWFDIPRAVLRGYAGNHLGDNQRQDTDWDSTTPVDVAALILAKSNEPEDHALLRSGVHRIPQSRGLWLGIAEIGSVGEDEHAIASSVFSNEKLPLATRVAAALAIAPNDQSASEFAATEMKRFDSRYGATDRATMLSEVYLRQEDINSYFSFLDHLRLVGLLRFSRAGWEKGLVLGYLNSHSKDIRMTAALVGGVRWPKEILEAEMTLFSDEERASVLASVVVHHPEVMPEFQRKYQNSNVQELVVRLRNVGMTGVFGLPGSIAYGL